MSSNSVQTIQVTSENEADLLAAAEAADNEAKGIKPADTEAEGDKPTDTDEGGDDGNNKPEAKAGLKIEKPADDNDADDTEKTSKDDGDKTDDKSGEIEAVDMQAFYNEYAETGTLNEESATTISSRIQQAFGIGEEEARGLLGQFVAGRDSQLGALQEAAYNAAGGEEAYTEITRWAYNNLSPAEQEAFNQAVDNPAMSKMAVAGLRAQFEASGGQLPTSQQQNNPSSPRVETGVRAFTGHAPVTSDQQVADLVSDPRFKTDPGFRADVEARIQASMKSGHLK